MHIVRVTAGAAAAAGENLWGQGAASLPLLGDVEHHDDSVAVLVDVEELCVQRHLVRLRTGRTSRYQHRVKHAIQEL